MVQSTAEIKEVIRQAGCSSVIEELQGGLSNSRVITGQLQVAAISMRRVKREWMPPQNCCSELYKYKLGVITPQTNCVLDIP
jgi:hypothetical protein